MIGMPVCYKDGINVKAGACPHHLLLCPLPAIKEQGVRPSPDHNAGRVPVRGRECSRCTQKIYLQCLAAHTKDLAKTERLRRASSIDRPSMTITPR